MRCFVLWCRNSSLNHREGVTFHKIPKDRYSEWLEAIKRPSDTLPHSSRRICSEHFSSDSFIPLRGRLRTLKPYVIPTLKLTQSQLLMRIHLNMPESQQSTSHQENVYEVETGRKLE
ncbi:peroxynitrite isomerase THAP4 isoform X2 [Leptinotarsa decemlineata]|uniref:peroxynitrite isomerase THAP4 isoform X2 n=1 Tax=Leptinotarsa decemlineata TaxID=7539 RepID=UPI000C254EAA|nr:THAP domain-containing protein 4-like isoform X2 [Leptinotarsa decemlineata]